jgi:hypothetical protein
VQERLRYCIRGRRGSLRRDDANSNRGADARDVHREPGARPSPLEELPMSTPVRTPPARPALLILLVAALLAVAALTLTPEGSGWAWGSPADELVWYASGLESEATMLQLAGNVGLLVVPAALAVLLWPGLGRPARLVGAAVATGAGIEVLQLTLSLGRVVAPLDAALNAAGAVLAGLLVASVDRLARPIPTT